MNDNTLPGGTPENDTPPSTPQAGQPEQQPEQRPEPRYEQPPQAPQYSAPQPPQYGQPQPPPYGQPQQPAYGAPQPGYGAPQPGYGQQPFPAPPYYGTPGPGGYFDGAQSPDDLTRPLYGATFGQAIRRFFKSYAKFDGRASRSEYWWIALFMTLVQIVPAIVLFSGLVAAIASSSSYNYNSSPSVASLVLLILGGFLYVAILLALLVPSLALGWRRLHDANFAGPLYLINLASAIPYVGWLGSVAVLVLSLMPSKVEGRRYDAV